jgi:hypothetical protein
MGCKTLKGKAVDAVFNVVVWLYMNIRETAGCGTNFLVAVGHVRRSEESKAGESEDPKLYPRYQ